MADASAAPVAEKSPRGSSEKGDNGKRPTTDDVEPGESNSGLERALHSQHLQFIAIGGTFGTGLFLGTGSALAVSGPLSLLIAYVFIATVVYSVMVSLGEMASYIPVVGSFTVYGTRFLDPAWDFALGWIYWFNWAITYALELTAAGLIIQYWDNSLSIAIWIAVFWAIFTAVNFLPIRWYGELEMWFSSIKVITVIGFIIFAICVNAGVGDQGYLGFKYWVHPGLFAEHLVDGAIGKFVGFWAVLITAGFSFQGAELVGVGAGETSNPEKAIPSAIRWTYWGITVLFIALVFFIGIDVPYTNENLQMDATDASASPLVIIADLSGVHVLAHIINAVLLTAVLSAANSNLYSSSRIMVALAKEGHAPALFARTNNHGTPYVAVALSSLLGLVGFLNLSASGAEVFTWLLNITSVAGFIAWALINACHVRFRQALRAQRIPLADLPYLAPCQPWLSWYGLFFNVLILVTNGFAVFIDWHTSDFFACYVSLIIFVALFVGYKVWFRTKMVPLKCVDLNRYINTAEGLNA
ncbi:putative arginine permease protein [Phaeoacremonium minimum UCRPA7]|uniref:Putative arginine permease protein n=1 Tax=Phaeoacremonium minimum (strain UCR-PA7) TaxID=1286976 RepID=R8BWQ7_PHAM7|nr:putative arginine permease protein [Phaeoacremonium minimum UCRPA7]EOO03777.1 putative arginine permease protein [Phaeoacremonium minimum UCRPA7]